MRVLLLTLFVGISSASNPRKIARIDSGPETTPRSEALDQLREDLEIISPGSTTELLKWAKEEQLIDSVADAANRTLAENPHPFSTFTLMIYHLYSSPRATSDEWVRSILRCFALRGITSLTPENVSSFIRGMYGYIRVPAWFFNVVSGLHLKGVKKENIVDAVNTIVQANPQAVFSNPAIRRGGKISSLVHVWTQFCASELMRGNSQACFYDLRSQEWELSGDAKLAFFRYLLLESFNPAKNEKLKARPAVHVKSEHK